jgi:hypothetical protein
MDTRHDRNNANYPHQSSSGLVTLLLPSCPGIIGVKVPQISEVFVVVLFAILCAVWSFVLCAGLVAVLCIALAAKLCAKLCEDRPVVLSTLSAELSAFKSTKPCATKSIVEMLLRPELSDYGLELAEL